MLPLNFYFFHYENTTYYLDSYYRLDTLKCFAQKVLKKRGFCLSPHAKTVSRTPLFEQKNFEGEGEGFKKFLKIMKKTLILLNKC
jgi:hypothetical protein